jgi:galactokinase/mevalonate kinase-like predicted kinase
MRTIDEIHAEIERENEQRHELWHLLSEGYDPAVAADIKALDERLQALWAEHRQTRATLRWGDRDHIVARARAEERLERTAA